MIKYILRRLAISLMVLFLLSAILYALIRELPTDYVDAVTQGNTAMTTEGLNRLRHLYGLDQNIIQGYLKWLKQTLKGDLGESLIYKEPVKKVIQEHWRISFGLSFLSLVLEVAVAIPLGVLSASGRGKIVDNLLTSLVFGTMSLPMFVLAALLQKKLSIDWNLLPLQGMETARYDYVGFDHILDVSKHMILPILAMTLANAGVFIRYIRMGMIEAMESDYYRTAKAKGLDHFRLLYHHAFINTLIPLISLVGLALPGLVTGTVVIENAFSIDGIGRIALQATRMGDIPLIMGVNVLIAVCVLTGNLICDLLYAFVDPRVRLS